MFMSVRFTSHNRMRKLSIGGAYVLISITDFSTNSESEQLLSAEARDETRNTCLMCVRLQQDERLSMNELDLQGDVSSSRLSLQDKSTTLNHNVHIEESSSSPTAVITLPLIIANDNESNDDPPPYSSITPPDHIGWPYGLFSFGDSYSTEMTRRMEIPLTPFQACLTPTTGFHPEGINDQYAPMLLTPYHFFKFGCRGNAFVPRETDNEIAEKIYDRKSRSEHRWLKSMVLLLRVFLIFKNCKNTTNYYYI